MTDTTELLPCPFCGGEAEILGSWRNGLQKDKEFTPSCNSPKQCPGQNSEQDEQGGFCASYGTREEAISAWNTRTDLIPAMLAEARAKGIKEAAEIIGIFDEAADCPSCTDVCAINEAVTALLARAEKAEAERERDAVISGEPQ